MKYENPKMVLQAWLDAVHSGDLDAVEAMYADDAVLIPTFSREFRSCAGSRRDYFAHLAAKPGLRVELLEESSNIRQIGENGFVCGGLYNWFYDTPNGPLQILARFSYVIDLSRNGPILHHHSSECPTS